MSGPTAFILGLFFVVGLATFPMLAIPIALIGVGLWILVRT